MIIMLYGMNFRSFTSKLVESTSEIKMLPLTIPHSCAFLNLNDDDYTPGTVFLTFGVSPIQTQGVN